MRLLVLSFFLAELLLIILFQACGPADPLQERGLSDSPELLAQIERGAELLPIHCEACHHPSSAMDQRLAPPMIAVKEHYLDEGSRLEDFQAELTRFVQQPAAEYAKMTGAIRRFGLMPALPLPEEDLAAIATYLYYADLEQPDWWEDHRRQHRKQERQHQQATVTDSIDYVAQGRQYALATKSQLGSRLMSALQKGGADYAVDFCNSRALPITDSMSQELGVTISRVSDRPRNLANAASADEIAIIAQIRQELQDGNQDAYYLMEEEEALVGFYPIVTNDMCLQCHGEPGLDIKTHTLDMLRMHYPEDQATGYAANALRGVWKVSMPRQ